MGNVLDTQTGIVYSSRSACIEALGRDVAVPMLRDRRFKRLRVITMDDKKKAMYEQGEHACVMAALHLEGAIRDIGDISMDGYDSVKFDDAACALESLIEGLEPYILSIREAGHYLGDQIEMETMRHEFQIDRRNDIQSMVQRL